MSQKLTFLEKPETFIDTSNGNGHDPDKAPADPIVLRALLKLKQRFINERDNIIDDMFAAMGEIARSIDDSETDTGIVRDLVDREQVQSQTTVTRQEYQEWRDRATFEWYTQYRHTLQISVPGAIDMLHELQDRINVELGKAIAHRIAITRGERPQRAPAQVD